MSEEGAKIIQFPGNITVATTVGLQPTQSTPPANLPNVYWPPPTPRTWSVSITDLGGGGLHLRFPVVVMLEDYAGAEVIASWPEVEAWGAGRTEADALNALKDEVVQLFQELDGTADKKLGKLPLRWKRALSAVVTKRKSRSR